jgi:signal transduction histidine kinase
MASEELEQLREALRLAQEELQFRESFLDVVAHELRNPLGPVLMSVDAMLIEVTRGSSDRDHLVHRLTQMRRYVQRLRGDLDRLLDFSRARNGKVDLELEDVDLCDVIQRTAADLEPLLSAAECQVNLALDRPQVGHWDAMRLGQIVWNLLTNAAKYAPSAPIDIVVMGTPRDVTMVVRDHGPGIAPSEREAVFRKFERSATAKQYTGFGIGLWLVRRIGEALGGSIALESEVNVGTTFTIVLPKSR